MQPGPELRTERLVLRRWREDDLVPLAALHADPVVMQTLGPPLDRAQSDAYATAAEAGFEERGFDFWAVEATGVAPFVGSIGVRPVVSPTPFAPAVEVGWRLAAPYWGHGYATEGAAAAVTFGFRTGLTEIVAFTAAVNHRSRLVMERIGMRRDPSGDFDHPRVPDGDALRPHVLYRCDPRLVGPRRVARQRARRIGPGDSPMSRSISSAGSACENRWPCANPQPIRRRWSACSAVSTPSAIENSPSRAARSTTDSTIASSNGSAPRPETNERSILIAWTGNSLRCTSGE